MLHGATSGSINRIAHQNIPLWIAELSATRPCPANMKKRSCCANPRNTCETSLEESWGHHRSTLVKVRLQCNHGMSQRRKVSSSGGVGYFVTHGALRLSVPTCPSLPLPRDLLEWRRVGQEVVQGKIANLLEKDRVSRWMCDVASTNQMKFISLGQCRVP